MAYDAIIAGARGLFFFGGQFKQVMSAADRERGWNWTYWGHVQRPLLLELTDAAHTAGADRPGRAHSDRGRAPPTSPSAPARPAASST